MTTRPFPVLCDRCRAEGLAGEAEFAELADLGYLLDFEPVPRRKRANGWDSEAQRAFIAALAVTGSDRQAAAVVGRNAFGVTQLCKSEGNEGFLAARAKAIEIFHEKERVRRSDGLLAAVHGEAARARGRHHLAWSGAATRREAPAAAGRDEPDSPGEEERRLQLLAGLLNKYRIKLEQERRARLEGKIAAADFYVRQITCIEVWADLLSPDLIALLTEQREEGVSLLAVAETPLSRLLDDVRRDHWARCGEPRRPPPVPRDELVDRGDFSIEPGEFRVVEGGADALADRRRALEERYRRQAEAQIAWEALAVEEAAAWRKRVEAEQDPSHCSGEEEAPPGAEGEDPPPEPPGGEEPGP